MKTGTGVSRPVFKKGERMSPSLRALFQELQEEKQNEKKKVDILSKFLKMVREKIILLREMLRTETLSDQQETPPISLQSALGDVILGVKYLIYDRHCRQAESQWLIASSKDLAGANKQLRREQKVLKEEIEKLTRVAIHGQRRRAKKRKGRA